MFRIWLVGAVVAGMLGGIEESVAGVINLSEAPYSAKGDGVADDRGVLSRAFAAARPGDLVLVPAGDYRMVLTGGPLAVPQGVTLLGQSGKSRFLLASNGGQSDYREFLKPQSETAIEGITIERVEDFPTVLLPISGDAAQITFKNCRIVGNQARYPKRICHAFRVGYGVVKDLTLAGVAVEDCCYGLFQPNDATGTLDGVVVEHCRFARNTASDLEFNSPKGKMRNIVVRDCDFRDNKSQSASGGFAVGFANVQTGRVENCRIENYGSEALHVEDRSSDIELRGNTIISASLLQPNGVILVVNNSKRVVIARNFIDARQNTNRAHLILVTAGGKSFANPSEVSAVGNVLLNGMSTRTWYLQEGSGPEPTANQIVPPSGK